MPGSDIAFPFDVKFTITGQDPMGFMLSVPKGQTKTILLQESDPPRFDRDIDEFSEIFRTSNPRNDTPFVCDDFSGGVGQLNRDEGQPNKYLWGANVITHVEGKAFPAPPVTQKSMGTQTGTPSKVFQAYVTGTYSRYDFVWVGTKLFRRPSSDNTTGWTEVWDAPAMTFWGLYQFNDKLYILGSQGVGIDFYIQSDITAAGPWSPTSKLHTGIDVLRDAVAVGNTLYVRTSSSGTSGNRIFFSTTPESDAWTGPIITGPDLNGWSQNRMIAINNFVFVMDDFAIYNIDPDQVVTEVVWQFKDKPNPTNFKYHAGYNSQLIFNVRNEVYSYDPINSEVRKLNLSNKDSFSVKSINGIASDQNFVYILATVNVPFIYNTSQDREVIFAAFLKNDEWIFEVIWEEATVSTRTFEHLTATLDTSRTVTRLYWTINYSGTESSNASATYMQEIPLKWDFSNESSFTTGSELYTSITKSKFPGFSKRQTYINGNFLNLNESNTISAAYKTNYTDSSYTTIFTSTTNTISQNYSNVYGDILALKFTFTSNGTVCPTLLDTTSHQRIRFLFIPTITLNIRVGNHVPLRNNIHDSRQVWEVWDDLKALRTTESNITYEDFLGNSFPVTVDLLNMTVVKNDSVDRVELEATIVITRKDKGS